MRFVKMFKGKGVEIVMMWLVLQNLIERHVTLSRSGAEAEYRGVANVVAETAWLRNLLLELHAPLSTATIVYCDNVSVVYLSTNPVLHQRTKHIEIDIHFVRDYVASGQVRVLHVPSKSIHANLPDKFWGDCVRVATYLINKKPMRILGWKSPFEMLHGAVPDYSHLSTMHCLCDVI
ncbi:NBS-containing resistance-like protein [Tanacetum coccineum]